MSFTPTIHPVLALPTSAEMARLDARELKEFLAARETLIQREREDPLRHGFEPWTFLLADACLAETAEEANALLDRAQDDLEARQPTVAAELNLRGRGEEVFGHTSILAMGQNRSGKTVWASKRVVRVLVKRQNGLGACFEASEQASINKQQPMIHKTLPPEWRNVGKEGQLVYVKYTKQNGFSGAKFTLPNGCQGLFFNYKQDVGVFEGYELDISWFDELVPLAFLEAMEFRLGQDRRLEELVTFTPVTGFTPTVGRYLSGARVVLTHKAELLPQDMVHVKGCPKGHLPLMMQCRNPERCVVWFPWGSNPYGANEEVRAKLVGASLAKIKIRAYGWTDKQVNGAFPLYGAAHRITRERFKQICSGLTTDGHGSTRIKAEGSGTTNRHEWTRIQSRQERTTDGHGWAQIPAEGGKKVEGVTRYVACDPAGAKNWFIKWYAVTPGGHTIVYREWPDLRTHGEWAVTPGGQDRTRLFDWRPGPAQRSEAGRGIVGYKRLILELEGWVWDESKKVWDGSKAEPIECRVMDPRFGGMEAPGEDEGTSIIAMMAEEQTDRDGNVTGPAMDWLPAPASRVEETVQMINDLMEWNPELPVTILNCPRWYVVAEDCGQSDLAYQEFTGAGTEKDALKDIVDPDRYFVKADLGYVAPGALASRAHGHR